MAAILSLSVMEYVGLIITRILGSIFIYVAVVFRADT